MTAGAGAGLVSSIVTCPLDVVKTRLQAQHISPKSPEYEGVRKTVTRIWRQAGARGFYRGLGPTVGGYLPTWGIYFTVYDLVKDKLGVVAERSGEFLTVLLWKFEMGGDVLCKVYWESWCEARVRHPPLAALDPDAGARNEQGRGLGDAERVSCDLAVLLRLDE